MVNAAKTATSGMRGTTVITKEGKSHKSDLDAPEDNGAESLLTAGFQFSMLIHTLLHYMTSEQHSMVHKSKAFQWFKSKTGRIEIHREIPGAGQKRLYAILFPIPEICQYMRDDAKRRFLWMHKR